MACIMTTVICVSVYRMYMYYPSVGCVRRDPRSPLIFKEYSVVMCPHFCLTICISIKVINIHKKPD